jgi:2',3'-cyclic-nucleotide 2'-phosphodiesterase (5'-nucleotidase family)
MGGLSKKAYQISILADKNTSQPILLDAGNLLFKQLTVAHSQELHTAAGLMEIYQQMAYDAVGVGQHDLAAGIEFLKNSQTKDFPWLSANLTDKQNRPIFPAAKIIERGAMKIGIIGLTGSIAALSPEIIVADWRKVLPEHLARLSKECRLVIVLSSLSSEDNAELTRQFPQIHVLLTADRQQSNIARVNNSSLVAQTMSQGKYLGILNLDWLPGSSWSKGREQGDQKTSGKEPQQLLSRFSSDFVPLSKDLPEDPQIAASIEAIKQKISIHNQQSAASAKQLDSATNQFFSGLAGSARCRECHPLQAQFWNSTRHAAAYATLQRQQQNFNLDCLPCHITKNPVPEPAAPLPVESLLALPPVLHSVGCEACHGQGMAHADAPDTFKPRRKVEEKTCVACHSKDRDPAFDYMQKLPKVTCPAG